jgi:hypothetical protein
MDCREFEEHIPAYLDRMGDGGILEAMDRHRSVCPECAHLLKIHEYIFATLDSTESVAAPAGLAERILAAAAAEEAVVVTIPPLHRRLLLAISTAAFVMLGGALAGLAGFILRSPKVAGVTDSISSNWTYLFEWPLLVKAWFLGLLTRQWIQTLVSPIHISSLGLTVPCWLIAAYALLIGVLGLYAWSYFHSPVSSGRMIPARSAHSRY